MCGAVWFCNLCGDIAICTLQIPYLTLRPHIICTLLFTNEHILDYWAVRPHKLWSNQGTAKSWESLRVGLFTWENLIRYVYVVYSFNQNTYSIGNLGSGEVAKRLWNLSKFYLPTFLFIDFWNQPMVSGALERFPRIFCKPHFRHNWCSYGSWHTSAYVCSKVCYEGQGHTWGKLYILKSDGEYMGLHINHLYKPIYRIACKPTVIQRLHMFHSLIGSEVMDEEIETSTYMQIKSNQIKKFIEQKAKKNHST